MNCMLQSGINQSHHFLSLNKISMSLLKQYTTTVSTEIRKIVFGLIIAVFGLAYKDNGIQLSDYLSLQIALALFFVYLILDIIEYLNGARMAYNDKKEKEIETGLLYFFNLKVYLAILGLFFCSMNIFGIF